MSSILLQLQQQQQAGSINYADLLAQVCTATGGSAITWTYQDTKQTIIDVYNFIIRIANVENLAPSDDQLGELIDTLSAVFQGTYQLVTNSAGLCNCTSQGCCSLFWCNIVSICKKATVPQLTQIGIKLAAYLASDIQNNNLTASQLVAEAAQYGSSFEHLSLADQKVQMQNLIDKVGTLISSSSSSSTSGVNLLPQPLSDQFLSTILAAANGAYQIKNIVNAASKDIDKKSKDKNDKDKWSKYVNDKVKKDKSLIKYDKIDLTKWSQYNSIEKKRYSISSQ